MSKTGHLSALEDRVKPGSHLSRIDDRGIGRRISGSDEGCEKFVVPGGGHSLEALGVFARGLADQIIGHVLERGKICRGVFGSYPAFGVAEDHIHDPVQAVLDRPVIADHGADQSRRQASTR